MLALMVLLNHFFVRVRNTNHCQPGQSETDFIERSDKNIQCIPFSVDSLLKHIETLNIFMTMHNETKIYLKWLEKKIS